MRISILLISFLLPSILFGQKLNVQEGNEVVETINRTGLFIIINWDDKKIEKAWEKKLKEFGKVQPGKDAYSITAAQIPGVTSNPGQIYSKVVRDGKGAKVWFSIDLGSSFVTTNGNKTAYIGASKILTDFATTCYRDALIEEIQAAEREVEKSLKNHEREVLEGQYLVKDVEKNRQEKALLEQKLVQNANDLKKIQSDIEKNKTDQKNALVEIDKNKKAVADAKQKLEMIGK